MIHVLVTYTISADFIEKNKQNIALFLSDFKKLDPSKFCYDVFNEGAGSTFIHLSEYADETIQQQLLNTPSFIRFQQERDLHILNNSHTLKVLTRVGSSST